MPRRPNAAGVEPKLIKARKIPRKSTSVPPAPANFLVPVNGKFPIDEQHQKKLELLEIRRTVLARKAAEEAELAKQKAEELAAKKRAEAEQKAAKAKASTSSKTITTKATPAQPKSVTSKNKPQKASAKTVEREAQEEEKKPQARTVAVPRRLRGEPVKPKGKRKNPVPEEQIVTVKTKKKTAPKEDVTKTSRRSSKRADPLPTKLPGGIAPYVADKDEVYMSAGQLTHFKKLLEAELAEKVQNIEQTQTVMQEKPTAQADPLDQATQAQQVEIDMLTREREQRAILKIQSSLRLIDNAEYGYCESCGDEIGLRRLEVRRITTKCIDCKNMDESEEKIYN